MESSSLNDMWHKSYEMKNTYVRNWVIELDGATHFLLNMFVLQFVYLLRSLISDDTPRFQSSKA